jgi:hypothetical protein
MSILFPHTHLHSGQYAFWLRCRSLSFFSVPINSYATSISILEHTHKSLRAICAVLQLWLSHRLSYEVSLILACLQTSRALTWTHTNIGSPCVVDTFQQLVRYLCVHTNVLSIIERVFFQHCAEMLRLTLRYRCTKLHGNVTHNGVSSNELHYVLIVTVGAWVSLTVQTSNPLLFQCFGQAVWYISEYVQMLREVVRRDFVRQT